MVALIMDIYSVTKSSTPSLVLPTQLPSMKLGDKTMMVLEIDEYCCPGPFYSASALGGDQGDTMFQDSIFLTKV